MIRNSANCLLFLCDVCCVVNFQIIIGGADDKYDDTVDMSEESEM